MLSSTNSYSTRRSTVLQLVLVSIFLFAIFHMLIVACESRTKTPCSPGGTGSSQEFFIAAAWQMWSYK